MPVEIRELIIRAVVDPQKAGERSSGANAPTFDRDALVQACVDETLRILRREKER
ncbi:conserved hypothetical protein [Bradyrhizobium sp. ORS 375]|uniref:DUF5908 family protein n=1 Tax=Bradyrhizobium sp. (strain ORS 375) TaxID=566679 RepID=UPI00024090A9|nr:DUF5908 family protein [Bradyrhizobium sp. ORS 375]CCD92142.1 conserved hypothetical protein [Bradyrhizobium sp. ORS 375]